METEQKLNWIKDQFLRADSAQRAIIAAKRQAVSEYDERLRKIRDFTEVLFVKRSDEQQMDLFKPDDYLDPALDSLLSHPLRGLG